MKARVDAEDLCVVGLRFTGDPLVPAERFDRLRSEFGERFVAVELQSRSKQQHSVLAMEYDPTPGSPTREAYEIVIEHFRRLAPT